jgi:hypothetical protein
MSGLVWKYGSYQHPVGEVYPQLIEARPVLSERGFRWATDVRMTIAGSFCRNPVTPLTPSELSGMIASLDAAYKDDYQDFGFLLPDGSPTAHFVYNNDVNNLSGNKVISRSWQYLSAAEFANTRSFQITVGARFVESYSEILYFKERLSLTGNGGPSWDYRARWRGAPIREEVSEKTPVTIVQAGTVFTLSSSPSPPDPWFPGSEQGEFRFVERIGGDIHGHPSFERATHYGLRYQYVFKMSNVPSTRPNFWIPR